MMERAGIRYARVDLQWSDVERDGPLLQDWSDFDAVVNAARRYHVTLLPMVAYTPGWANGGRGSFTPPNRASDFQRFLTTAFRRYRGIPAWEVWNEPNLARFARPWPNPGKFVELLRAAYRARTAAGSHTKLISGGLAVDGEIPVPRFVDAIARLGGLKYIDGLGIHPYSTAPPDDPHSYFLTLPALHGQLADLGKPRIEIWATEYGWAADNDDRRAEWDQSRRLATAYAIAVGWPWLRNLTWYGMRDDCMDAYRADCRYGLVDQDFQPKPAYWVLRDLIAGRVPKIRSLLWLQAGHVSRGRHRRYFLTGSAFTPGTRLSGSWITLRLRRYGRHRVRRRTTYTRLRDGSYRLSLGRLRPGRWRVRAAFPGTTRYLRATSEVVRFRVPRRRHHRR